MSKESKKIQGIFRFTDGDSSVLVDKIWHEITLVTGKRGDLDMEKLFTDVSEVMGYYLYSTKSVSLPPFPALGVTILTPSESDESNRNTASFFVPQWVFRAAIDNSRKRAQDYLSRRDD